VSEWTRVGHAGTHGDDLIERESFWKVLLLTRTFGLNAN
jgi:hypothetical protein